MIAFARTEGRYRMHTKFIFVTGGVVSSLGKGITAASLGRLLKSRGLKVSMQKFDPYINVDPGTMNPYQHGEVFVTDDGAETDLDLGHYERFIDESLTQAANVTSGQRVLYRHHPRAQGRVSGRDHPGHPAHHQRDQAPHAGSFPQGRRAGRGHHRNRRHGRRYRVPAVPRSGRAN